jgi:hypothetical protein
VAHLITYRAKLIPKHEFDPFPSEEAPVLPPVAAEPIAGSGLLARAPVIDRYPIVIGQNLTGQYLTTAYRSATSGWRYQLVDLLNELLEHDAHARGVVRQRILAVAGGRLEVLPAKLRKDHPDAELAQLLAEEFSEQLLAIPALVQSIAQLNWSGVFYGLGGLEIEWDNTDEGAWCPVGLSLIHSRRLNYTNPTTWDVYIYDQGTVGPGYKSAPTNGIAGLRVADFPGKFIMHAPALNGDYPTRDGEGRYIGIYMLLKRAVMRASAQDFERTIRPWVLGYFNREGESVQGGNVRSVANDEDIKALEKALSVLGNGAMSNAALPDSVRVELLRAASAMSATEFLSFLNREMSKGLLGQAFTTEPGANGNLSTSQMAKEGTMEILRYDARCLADTLERDLVHHWVKLNYPEAKLSLAPRIVIHVDEIPDPEKVMKIALQGTQIDMPIDADKLAEQTGLELIPARDPNVPRRTRMIQSGKAPEPAGPENDDATPDTAPEQDDDSAESGGNDNDNAKKQEA